MTDDRYIKYILLFDSVISSLTYTVLYIETIPQTELTYIFILILNM